MADEPIEPRLIPNEPQQEPTHAHRETTAHTTTVEVSTEDAKQIVDTMPKSILDELVSRVSASLSSTSTAVTSKQDKPAPPSDFEMRLQKVEEFVRKYREHNPYAKF